MERTDPPSLAERYGYHFTDASLLQLALRHASFASEHELDSNERLEFLGDAILGFVVVEHLWKSYPQLDEGHLAKVKAVVVSSAVLAERALAIGLDGDLELGRSLVWLFCWIDLFSMEPLGGGRLAVGVCPERRVRETRPTFSRCNTSRWGFSSRAG